MLLDLQISPEKVKGCSLKDLSWGTCMVGELDEDLHVAFHASLNACRKRHDVYNYEKNRKNHGEWISILIVKSDLSYRVCIKCIFTI